jgi:hypothetical protein
MRWFRRTRVSPEDEDRERKKVEIEAANRQRLAQTATQRDLVTEVSRILFEADSIGLSFESNTDEYEAEAKAVVIGLADARGPDDVRSLTHEAFVQWFDPRTAGPAERYASVATAIWDAWRRAQGQSALNPGSDASVGADAAVRGSKITGVFFVHDFIEVHMDDVVLTGYTEPFGLIGCQGVGPSSITLLIGKTVEQLSVVEGEYVAIDSGEDRLAFPIGGDTERGPESVRLYRPAQDELGIPSAHWTW